MSELVDRLRAVAGKYDPDAAHEALELAAASRIEQLERALGPLAALLGPISDKTPDDHVLLYLGEDRQLTVGDLRRARSALLGDEG